MGRINPANNSATSATRNASWIFAWLGILGLALCVLFGPVAFDRAYRRARSDEAYREVVAAFERRDFDAVVSATTTFVEFSDLPGDRNRAPHVEELFARSVLEESIERTGVDEQAGAELLRESASTVAALSTGERRP